jgi:hypothetical protein
MFKKILPLLVFISLIQEISKRFPALKVPFFIKLDWLSVLLVFMLIRPSSVLEKNTVNLFNMYDTREPSD